MRRLLVVAWHNVDGTFAFPSRPGTGRRGLVRQLQLLRNVANVVSLGEALATLRSGAALPARAVAITFDDGYRDNVELAAPLLRRLGLPATFFLVPGLLSATTRAWWEVTGWAFARAGRSRLEWDGGVWALHDVAARRLAYVEVAERLKRRPRVAREQAVDELVHRLAPDGAAPDDLFAGWDGARELAARFTIGSHTMHHAILSQETPVEQRRDLIESRDQLRRELDVPVELLAYPNGTALDYDHDTIAAAEHAGYAAALTTRYGWNGSDTPPFEVHRLVMYPERGALGLLATLAKATGEQLRARRPVAGGCC